MPVYSVSAVVPGTGHVLEVVSEGLEPALRGPFARAPASACPSSTRVRQSVMEMRSLWWRAGGSVLNAQGFPDLLVVKVGAGENVPSPLGTFPLSL